MVSRAATVSLVWKGPGMGAACGGVRRSTRDPTSPRRRPGPRRPRRRRRGGRDRTCIVGPGRPGPAGSHLSGTGPAPAAAVRPGPGPGGYGTGTGRSDRPATASRSVHAVRSGDPEPVVRFRQLRRRRLRHPQGSVAAGPEPHLRSQRDRGLRWPRRAAADLSTGTRTAARLRVDQPAGFRDTRGAGRKRGREQRSRPSAGLLPPQRSPTSRIRVCGAIGESVPVDAHAGRPGFVALRACST